MDKSQAPFLVYNASAGSGKTYTLVKNYLKILLNTSNQFQFQEILAMTFTNKAAAEMKTRILETLDAFQNSDFSDSMFLEIKKELNLTNETLQKRAKNIFNAILNQYGGFNISTIDSFTYKVVKSFAFDLGLTMNFEVEMDPISLINEAIDVLLSKIGTEKELSKTLIQFAKEKANDDKDWNIEGELQAIAKLLLNEDDIKHLNLLNDKKLTDFTNLNSTLFHRIKKEEKYLIALANNAFNIINATNLQKEDFTRGGFYSFFAYLKNLQLDKININGTLEKNIQKDHHQSSGKASAAAKEEIQQIKPQLIKLYQEAKWWFKNNYPQYQLDVLVKKSLIPLSVLKSIQQILNEIKSDNNILFNAEFNQILSNHLVEQPAAFIYEKIGEKFRHYFIDEMQDTSILQWQNSIPLIKNALESEDEKGKRGSLLLVGDAKQSIYRWRGSKPEQFINLSLAENPFFVPKKTETLDTNYRSHENIISFNNHFFRFLGNCLQNETYKNLYLEGNKQKTNAKKGGYVEISFLENLANNEDRDVAYPKKILEIIKNLDGKFNKNEICILTRNRKQGVAIANYLSAHNIEIVSSESLLLENSPKVQFLTNLLQYIHQPKDKKTKFNLLNFLYYHFNLSVEIHDFFNEFIDLEITEFFKKLQKIGVRFHYLDFLNFPFYDSIEYSIRSFKLTKKSDAYLQFFLDFVLEFSQKNNSGLTEFINLWEEKKEKLSIVVPQGKDAVTIMTIHKAKGLEFPVIIYAYDLDVYKTRNDEKIWYPNLDNKKYNNFNTMLVSYSKSKLEVSGNTGKQLVKQNTEELELDNFNLLYVALTRAKEQLYILTEYKAPKKPTTLSIKKYGAFFNEFLKNNPDFKHLNNRYFFGNPNRVSVKEKPAIINEEQTEFLSSSWQEHQITIVANTSIESNFNDARKYGTLLHEILAKVNTKEDIDKAIDSFVNTGIIPAEEETKIKKIITNIVTHPKLSLYFTEEFQTENEREIVTEDKSIIIPDRIAIKNNKATIIDYKTGNKEKAHHIQINKYACVLEKMEFHIENKLLVYIQSDFIEIEEVA